MSILILISVIPDKSIRSYDFIFFAIFGIEFVVRSVVFFKVDLKKRGVSIVGNLMLLFLDFIAVLSFGLSGFASARITRVIRLFRLFYLSRTTGRSIKDFLEITKRRKYEIKLVMLIVLLTTFISGIVFSSFEMDFDFNGDNSTENVTLWKSFWWAFLQIEDPGNLVTTPEHSTLIFFLSLILTLTGVVIMSFIIGIGTNLVAEIIASRKDRSVDFREHVVAIVPAFLSASVITRLTAIYKKNSIFDFFSYFGAIFLNRSRKFVLVSDEKEFPLFLYDKDYQNVDYRSGLLTSTTVLNKANITEAEKIVIVSDDTKGEMADANTLSTLLAINSLQQIDSSLHSKKQEIYLEVIYKENCKAALFSSGVNVHPIEISFFMGIITAITALFPGLEYIFDELFTEDGSEIYTTPASNKNITCKMISENIVSINGYLHEKHDSIVLGYIDENGILSLNPAETLLLNEGKDPVSSKLKNLVVLSKNQEQAAKAVNSLPLYKTSDTKNKDVFNKFFSSDIKLDPRFGKLKKVIIVGCRYFTPAMIIEILKNVPHDKIKFEMLISKKNDLDRIMNIVTKHFNGNVLNEKFDNNKGTLIYSALIKIEDSKKQAAFCVKLLADSHTIGKYIKRSKFDRLILLSEPMHSDPDAATIMLLMNLYELINKENIQVVAEIVSEHKSDLLENTMFNRDNEGRVHVLSTGRIRSNFIVQSAYFDNFIKIYSELLSAEGMDLVKLHLKIEQKKDVCFKFSEIISSLNILRSRKEGVPTNIIPIGIEIYTQSGRVIKVNPPYNEEFKLSEIRSIYAIGEIDNLNY